MGQLKYRKNIGSTMDLEVIERLDNMSKQTGIPKARIMEKATIKAIEEWEKQNSK